MYEEYLELPEIEKFQLREMDEEDMMKKMKHQQAKLNYGIDTINNRIVKTCHKELAKPIKYVINKSINESNVPQAFKRARIIPLYKKGAANECDNYRPVSLLSALSKILEKAIYIDN